MTDPTQWLALAVLYMIVGIASAMYFFLLLWRSEGDGPKVVGASALWPITWLVIVVLGFVRAMTRIVFRHDESS